MQEKEGLRRILDRFYDEYDFRTRLLYDPIEFPHRYMNHYDKEASAFISASLAYGKVGLFKPVIEKILSGMGRSPYSFLLEFDVERHRNLFALKYRFNESGDIVCLLYIIHKLLETHSSLEKAFKKHYSREDPNVGGALTGFVREIMTINTSSVYGKNLRPAGLKQFFPSPAGGSACKRMNLFLRWMVRDKDIDFGIWKEIPQNKLVIPLDTHIARIGRCLGLTERKSADWKAAVEITECLKAFDPEDPLKYDFALCHYGISGMCSRLGAGQCDSCNFSSL